MPQGQPASAGVRAGESVRRRRQCGAGLISEGRDQLRGERVAGEFVCLASPEVHQVRVAGGAGGGAQRPGQVVDLRIRDRGWASGR